MENFASAWANFVDSYKNDNPLMLTFYVPFALMTGTYILFGGALLLIDIIHKPDIIYSTKVQPARVLRVEKTIYNPSLLKFAGLLLLNFTITLPACIVLSHPFYSYVGNAIGYGDFGWIISRELPNLWHVLAIIVWAAASNEVLFFYSHWLLHHRLLYPWIHKIHHEAKAPIGLAAVYAHPLEVVVGNFFATTFALYVPGAHLLLVYVFAVVGIVITVAHHSGYSVLDARHHDFHHSHNIGNYGTMGIMDWLHGTSKAYHNYLKRKKM
mmetsp:Transcript_24177/g.67712  ORF Transcript_24177/g.67712 Transcript_24177/m.67712 type:complete len:268 (-) Transcript_24177:224-1027(-)